MQPLRWHRPLLVMTAVMAALAVVSLAGIFLDPRVFLGAPIWAKPLKFGISTSIYALTLAWLLSLSRRAPRTCWWLGTTVAVTLSVEVALVVVQVIRGEASHFGGETGPWQHLVDAIMRDTIMVFLTSYLVLGLLLAFQRIADAPTRTAIRAGLGISLAGMFTGFLMFANVTPAQVARLERHEPTLLGGHSVGVPSGGPGMPVTYWSTTGGDLRIPHFVGLHALQVLPLLALGLWLLARRFPMLRDERVRTRLVRVGAAGYAGIFGLTLWQALRGQPLLAPDAQTLAALGAVFVLCALAAAATLTRGPVDRPNSGLTTGRSGYRAGHDDAGRSHHGFDRLPAAGPGQ